MQPPQPRPLCHVFILLKISQGLPMICKTKNTPNSLLCWSHLPAWAPPCLSGLMMVWRFFQSHDLDICCNLHWNHPLHHVHTCVSWRIPALPSHPSSSLPCSSRPSTFLVPWDTQNQLSVSELRPSLSFSHPLDCQPWKPGTPVSCPPACSAFQHAVSMF